MRRIKYFVLLLSFSVQALEVRDHQLVIDGKNQPQLFGAEVQYFRLRGDYGPNVPRAKVIKLWNKALDHLVDAKMNAISFYIPWDFHEYAEGKFDFTGTADVDQDGAPDYPSRDLITFFKLVAEHGITRIMVRPGPYINAEWGFLGFGAIPLWFHEKYPTSHMQNPYGLRSRLYDYHSPDLIRHTQLWFKKLYEQVLEAQIGPGKPVVFLQLDNETNFQWQSIYNHDFKQSAISRYQEFLKDVYQYLETLNLIHGRNWARWSQIQPTTYPGRSIIEDQDWYRFSDHSIFSYLVKIKNLWQQIGVSEPSVLFTLAESYNATVNGLLPNFVDRNTAGLMTVNLYPKTMEDDRKPLLNFPFKADLDVKAADEANDLYFGSRQEWVMGPEIQGGWWRGINVTPEARQQTYLTVLGHGLKAFFVYYFNEGQNWDVEWSYNQIKPLYDALLRERHQESEDFWNELQARSDRKILVGFDVRRIIKLGPNHDVDLFFDAPLDGQANPRAHYFHLKQIGERVIAPYQNFLARSLEVHDDVALVKDSTSHQPVSDANIPAVQAVADWTGGLLGYMMNADINPRILHGDISNETDFKEPKLLLHLDTGLNAPRTLEMFKQAAGRGQTIVNFLANDLSKNLGVDFPAKILFTRNSPSTPLVYYVNSKPVNIMSSNPVYSYDLSSKNQNCEGILFWQDKVVGYRCKINGATIVQIGANIFEDYNSNAYSQMSTPTELRLFLKALAKDAGVKSRLELSEEAKQTVAFARKDPEGELLWITVKTGALAAQTLSLKINSELINPSISYKITNLLPNQTQTVLGADLITKGFSFTLAPNDSAVFVLRAIKKL